MTTVIWNQFALATEPLRAALTDVQIVDVPLNPGKSPEPPAEILLALSDDGLSADELATTDVSWADGLKWIHAFPTGIEQFPPALLEGRRVTATKGVWGIPVAEYAITAILSHEKRIPGIFDGDPGEPFSHGLLEDQTLGIVGLGSIGREAAVRARAFGMRVMATRRSHARPPIDGVEPASLDEVLAAADHLLLAVPLTDTTNGLIDADALHKVKPGVHIINVARGAVVDHDALAAALDDGRVGAATLDVTDPEPLPASHPLRLHPGVRISPHVATMTRGILDRGYEMFIENVRRYRAGEPLLGQVDLAAGY